MGRIHGTAYFIIGFFVSFVSWVFDFRKLIIFFIIGVIFSLYGAARLGIDIYEYTKEKKERKSSHAQAQHTMQQNTYQQNTYRPKWKHCKKCGTANYLGAKFCHSCGNTTFHIT